MLCIDSSVTGTDLHLLVDKGYLWVPSIPSVAWHLSNDVKTYHPRCLNSLFKLDGLNINTSPPERFVKSMNAVCPPNIPRPWAMIMPQDAHREFVRRVCDESMCNLEKIDPTYFCDVWDAGNDVLRSLLPAKVDVARVNQIIEDSGMNRKVVEGLIPDASGCAMPIVYDRFGTRTGRLTVRSGPGILTMKKEYRDAFISSFEGGNIVSLDFSALEVRVLLYEMGRKCDEEDLYSFLARSLFSGEFDRKAVKAAVIAESYGSGKASLSRFLGMSGTKLDVLVENLREFLGIKSLKDKVSHQYWKNGYIRNRYGKKVFIEEPMSHIFVNSYAQSTGVDVSLLGFNEVIKLLVPGGGIRPLFVLHDELILDVSPSRIKDVLNIKFVNVPGYTQNFPMRSKILK